jgi:hypothetical protein
MGYLNEPRQTLSGPRANIPVRRNARDISWCIHYSLAGRSSHVAADRKCPRAETAASLFLKKPCFSVEK